MFHLTVIVHKDTNVSSNKKEQIRIFLDDFDYEIKLTILKTDKIHDRNILTNYMWINSGYGFELFDKGNVFKETQLLLFPITYLKTDFRSWINKAETDLKNTVLETVTHLLKTYKDINEKTQRYWGGKKCIRRKRKSVVRIITPLPLQSLPKPILHRNHLNLRPKSN